MSIWASPDLACVNFLSNSPLRRVVSRSIRLITTDGTFLLMRFLHALYQHREYTNFHADTLDTVLVQLFHNHNDDSVIAGYDDAMSYSHHISGRRWSSHTHDTSITVHNPCDLKIIIPGHYYLCAVLFCQQFIGYTIFQWTATYIQ